MKFYSIAAAAITAACLLLTGGCTADDKTDSPKAQFTLSTACVTQSDIVSAHDSEEGGEIGGNDEQYDGQLAVPAHISLDRISITSEIYPPLTSARVTSVFGYRQNPVTGKFTFHSGYDLAAASGSNIYAMLSGRVATAKWDDGYGYYLIIEHEGGVQTLYAHCSELLAEVGDSVEKGEVVAKVGSTGTSTGPHLHVEFRMGGKRYDPEWVLGGIYG